MLDCSVAEPSSLMIRLFHDLKGGHVQLYNYILGPGGSSF